MKRELRKIYNAAARTWKKYGYATHVFRTNDGPNYDMPCFCFVGAAGANGNPDGYHDYDAIERQLDRLGALSYRVESLSDNAGSKGKALRAIKKHFEGIK